MSAMQRNSAEHRHYWETFVHTTQGTLITTHLMLSWNLLLKADRCDDLWEQAGNCN
jgi:hypothetical protein